MKEFKLFRYYISREYIELYLSNRDRFDNYIINIAIISQYFIINQNSDIYFVYKYIYKELFDSPYNEEKYLGSLRYLKNKEYETNNKYLLAIPIAINYCKKVNCFDDELRVIDTQLLDKLYKKDNLTGTYHLKMIN